MLAPEWIREDADWQLHLYNTTGKRPKRLNAPEESWFVSQDEFHAALAGRNFLCDDPQHEGRRLLQSGEYNDKGGKTCKQCKARKVKAHKDANKPILILYETAEDFLKLNAKWTCDSYPEMTIGNCPAPNQAHFPSSLEYDRALVLRDQHVKDFRRQFAQHHKKRNNETARERYNEKKQTEDGRHQLAEKTKADQKNKKARMQAVLDPDKQRCPVGPHDAPKEDFLFDPVEDLGFQDYKGRQGRIRRCICKKHFCKAVQRYRRHNSKPERKAYNQRLELQKRVKDIRKLWKEENRERYNIQKTKWSARIRGLEYQLSEDKEKELFSLDARCYHCGIQASGVRPLGPDRLDPKEEAYTDEGTVSCCKPCNFARGGMEVDVFHKACANVANYQCSGVEAKDKVVYVMGNDKRRCLNGVSFAMTCYDAARKGLVVELTKEEHAHLVSLKCYLCGVSGRLGIDRKDSKEGYTKDNSFPCCTCCNYMKKNLAFDEFVALCRRVNEK